MGHGVPSNFVANVVESLDSFAIRKVTSGVESSIHFATVGVGMLASNLSHSLEGNVISVVIVLQRENMIRL